MDPVKLPTVILDKHPELQSIGEALAAYREGRDPVAAARAVLIGLEPDYVAVADLNGRPTLAVAARVGRIRLIDNVVLDLTSASPGPGIAERGQSAKESGNEQPTAAHRT